MTYNEMKANLKGFIQEATTARCDSLQLFIINKDDEITEKVIYFNYKNSFKVYFEEKEVSDLDKLIFSMEKDMKFYNVFLYAEDAERFLIDQNKKKLDEEIELFLA